MTPPISEFSFQRENHCFVHLEGKPKKKNGVGQRTGVVTGSGILYVIQDNLSEVLPKVR